METTEKYPIKFVGHFHPHFYNPDRDRKHNWDEWAYRAVFPMPSLRKIIEVYLRNQIGIGVISAAHTPTSIFMDNSFGTYLQQLPTLEKDFDFTYIENKAGLVIARKKPIENELSFLVLLHGQEIRAKKDKNQVADIHALGITKLIHYELSIEDAAHMIKNEGGVVWACHPNSPMCSLGLEQTINMIRDKKLDSFEEQNDTETLKINQDLRAKLQDKKYWVNGEPIKGMAVNDGHSLYQLKHGSYILVKLDLYEKYSNANLAQVLRLNNFQNYYGYIPAVSRHLHHTLPIVVSIPGHCIRHPEVAKKTFVGIGKLVKSRLGFSEND